MNLESQPSAEILHLLQFHLKVQAIKQLISSPESKILGVIFGNQPQLRMERRIVSDACRHTIQLIIRAFVTKIRKMYSYFLLPKGMCLVAAT